MKRSTWTFGFFLLLGLTGSVRAGLYVDWYVGYGIFGYGVYDTRTLTPGTGVAAGNPVLWQLIWAGPNNAVDAPNTNNAAGGYAGGDDVVLTNRLIAAGAGNGTNTWDQWLYISSIDFQPYSNAAYTVTAGTNRFYQRIYQGTNVVLGTHYYSSPLTALNGAAGGPGPVTYEPMWADPDSTNATPFGARLDQTIGGNPVAASTFCPGILQLLLLP